MTEKHKDLDKIEMQLYLEHKRLNCFASSNLILTLFWEKKERLRLNILYKNKKQLHNNKN